MVSTSRTLAPALRTALRDGAEDGSEDGGDGSEDGGDDSEDGEDDSADGGDGPCADPDANPCGEHGICENSIGDYSCLCGTGFVDDGTTCVDIDECADADLNECGEGMTCENEPGTWACACLPGYTPFLPGGTLDDGTPEANIGRTSGGMFLWFNRFSLPLEDFPLTISEIQVYFRGSDSNVAVGDVFDLFVFRDDDEDPANGAELLTLLSDRPLQELDGFSRYDVDLVVEEPGDLLIGAISRKTESGYFPAALDQGSSQGRSWGGFPGVDGMPATPVLTELSTLGIIDGLGFPGNWLIRASFTPASVSQCFDIDECASPDAFVCEGEGAVCGNTPGSYECLCDEGYEDDGESCVPVAG